MTATLHTGDALGVLRTLPDGAVRCCVTSPPYWGLRDYGMPGQFGLERTPEEYVEHLVAVMREVRRVLTDDGTLWLNLGDSYANPSAGAGGRGIQWSNKGTTEDGIRAFRKDVSNLKQKDLVGIPWRVAFALQADGWYLRSDIIWAKPNPMPESVTDRPTKAHEYMFLLSKSARYYYDAAAIREDGSGIGWNSARGTFGRPGPKGRDIIERQGVRTHGGDTFHPDIEQYGRNARTVWTIATQPYPEAHFATFPEELARRCILAGTSQAGNCAKCGVAWERITLRAEPTGRVDTDEPPTDARDKGIWSGRCGERQTETLGWCPTCDCGAPAVPDTVLDPFGGSGTVAAVAVGNGRHSIYIDLNPEYVELAKRRIGPMFCEVSHA